MPKQPWQRDRNCWRKAKYITLESSISPSWTDLRILSCTHACIRANLELELHVFLSVLIFGYITLTPHVPQVLPLDWFRILAFRSMIACNFSWGLNNFQSWYRTKMRLRTKVTSSGWKLRLNCLLPDVTCLVEAGVMTRNQKSLNPPLITAVTPHIHNLAYIVPLWIRMNNKNNSTNPFATATHPQIIQATT